MSPSLVSLAMVMSVAQPGYEAPRAPLATMVIQLPRGATLRIDRLDQTLPPGPVVPPAAAAFPPGAVGFAPLDQAASPALPVGGSMLIIPPGSHVTVVASAAAPVVRPGDRTVIFLPSGGAIHVGPLQGGPAPTHPFAIGLGASRLVLDVPPEPPVPQQAMQPPYYPGTAPQYAPSYSPSYGGPFSRFRY
jgi:hypothetical protein